MTRIIDNFDAIREAMPSAVTAASPDLAALLRELNRLEATWPERVGAEEDRHIAQVE